MSDSFSESKSTSQEQNYGSKKTGNSNFLRFSKLMWIWEAHTPWKYLKCRRKYSEKLKNPLSFYLVCKHLSIEKNLWRSQTTFIIFQNIFFGYHLSHQIGIFPTFCLALKWKNKRTFSPEHIQVRTNTAVVYPLEALPGILTKSLDLFTFTFPRDINHYEMMRGGEGSQIQSNIHLK